MQIHSLQPGDPNFPPSLTKLTQPVQKLYVRGNLQALHQPAIAVIGSRAVTDYGREATTRLVSEIAWQKNLVIISGLALGVDSLAHQAALEADGTTIAVLPSGIENIYPHTHQRLAKRIIQQGGAIISEYPGTQTPRKFHFIARNRIIAGLSQAVLVTEATQRSGSLHTAQFALDAGKDVLAVPGDIFRPNSVGTNNLIATGAHPIRSAQDILNLFNNLRQMVRGDNPQEEILLKLITSGKNRSHELYKLSNLPVAKTLQTLTMLEIKGIIKNNGHGQWSII